MTQTRICHQVSSYQKCTLRDDFCATRKLANKWPTSAQRGALFTAGRQAHVVPALRNDLA
jgi:hypothetical protein